MSQGNTIQAGKALLLFKISKLLSAFRCFDDNLIECIYLNCYWNTELQEMKLVFFV
jgi:hypothetical protein